MPTTNTIEIPSPARVEALENRVGYLEKIVKALESLPPEPEWYTVDQVRELIGGRDGGKPCRKKINALIKSGELIRKHNSIGIRISSKSVREYNLKHTIK